KPPRGHRSTSALVIRAEDLARSSCTDVQPGLCRFDLATRPNYDPPVLRLGLRSRLTAALVHGYLWIMYEGPGSPMNGALGLFAFSGCRNVRSITHSPQPLPDCGDSERRHPCRAGDASTHGQSPGDLR